MATINRQSLREESERIKKDFERLSASKNLDKEFTALFKSMLMLISLLVSVFLEKNLKKNNKNSSKSSSQTDKDESSTKKGTKAKGKSELNQTANNTRTVESSTISKVSLCNVCGSDLTKTPCSHIERRTKIDIVFEKVIEHVDAEVKICGNCESSVKGNFPYDMSGPLQYGNGIKAYAINLLICQMVSLNRIQNMLKSIMGEVISQASILKFVLRLHQALEKWEKVSIERLLLSPAINVDETSLRVDKKNHWIHVYAAEELTLKFLHPKRGKEAMNDINIIPRYSGVLIHDCLSSYLSYDNCEHGLCGSHLSRELNAAIESNNYRWAINMKKLLLKTCKKISKLKRKKLKDREYANLQKRYRNILSRGQNELPIIPKKLKSKRGVIAKSDAHNLWERLKKYEASVLLFAKKSEVSFTNNRAEQDLRMAKVKQKVSGCFRAQIYAQAYCRISSYLQTMANKGHNPLIAIQMALAGEEL